MTFQTFPSPLLCRPVLWWQGHPCGSWATSEHQCLAPAKQTHFLCLKKCIHTSQYDFDFFHQNVTVVKILHLTLYEPFSSSRSTTHPTISILPLVISLFFPKDTTLYLSLLKCLLLFSDYFLTLSRALWILILSNVPAVPPRLMPPANLISLFSFHHLSH